MQRCPQCDVELQEIRTKAGFVFACPTCAGALVSLPVLRRTLRDTCLQFIWQVARASPVCPRLCPACGKRMHAAPTSSDPAAATVDVCPLCQMIWFDPGEYENLPKAPPPPREKELSPEAREAAARLALRSLQDRCEVQQAADSTIWSTGCLSEILDLLQ